MLTLSSFTVTVGRFPEDFHNFGGRRVLCSNTGFTRIEINANYYARAVGDCFRWLHTVWLKFCLLNMSSHFGILPGLCLHRALLWTTACAACSALDRRRRCLHCSGPPPALPALLWTAACAACTPRTSCLACCASHLQLQMFDARCWSHRAPPSPEQLDWRAFFTNHTFVVTEHVFCCH